MTLTPEGGVNVQRDTAESEVSISLWRGQGGQAKSDIQVADSIDVSSFPDILNAFCEAADLHMDVTFKATMLSSSHVVLEDIGLTMGAAHSRFSGDLSGSEDRFFVGLTVTLGQSATSARTRPLNAPDPLAPYWRTGRLRP